MSESYYPYRQVILSRDELRELSTLAPLIAVKGAVCNWLLILSAWSLVALFPSWWTIVLSILVVGTRYYSLTIIGHDGLHRRLFKNPRHNDLFNDLFIMGPIGAITRINRINHIEHHRITAQTIDPDRHKYLHDGKEPTVPFLFFLTGLSNLWPTVRNVFLNKGSLNKGSDSAPLQSSKPSYRMGDLLILALWQTCLIAGLTYFIGWWAYIALWLLPVYLFAYRADLVRVFCEHSMLMPDDQADASLRMVHFESNWLERQFFAPNNMNCHIAHHLWPGIPYYNLPIAEAKVREWDENGGSNGKIIWRTSYVRYLFSYFVWRRSTVGASFGRLGEAE
jgi:fatty acid desaturase